MVREMLPLDFIKDLENRGRLGSLLATVLLYTAAIAAILIMFWNVLDYSQKDIKSLAIPLTSLITHASAGLGEMMQLVDAAAPGPVRLASGEAQATFDPATKLVRINAPIRAGAAIRQ
jgi:hypothetical protein